MRRRDVLAMVCSAAAVASHPAAAQAIPSKAVPGRRYRLAVVHPTLPASAIAKSPNYAPLFDALKELGYFEGQNLIVEPYSAEGYSDRFGDVAREAVRGSPDAIHATLNPIVHELQKLTTTIPIVGAVGDPIALGTVTSMSRPGGNFTGVSTSAGLAIWGKRFQLLKEIVPGAKRFAYLCTPLEWNSPPLQSRIDMFRQLGGELVGPWVGDWSEQEVRRGLAALVTARPDGVVITDAGSVLPRIALVATHLNEHQLPAIYPWPRIARSGGLIAYGYSASEWGRDSAERIHRVLNGVPAGEIPIAQPTKFELVINLKTAIQIGVEVPASVLASADEVIE